MPAEVGANVTVPIPDLDKAKDSLRKVISVVLRKNNNYSLELKRGFFKNYIHGQSLMFANRFIWIDKVKKNIRNIISECSNICGRIFNSVIHLLSLSEKNVKPIFTIQNAVTVD